MCKTLFKGAAGADAASLNLSPTRPATATCTLNLENIVLLYATV
jgi:hypothetical protein